MQLNEVFEIKPRSPKPLWIIVLILAVGGSALLWACGQVKEVKITAKTDTVQVVCRQQDNQTFIDSAIRTVYQKREFKDSSSLEGVMINATSYRLMQVADTLIDSLHRPIFDANHAPRFRYVYSVSAVPDSLNKYIHVIDIPYWPRK